MMLPFSFILLTAGPSTVNAAEGIAVTLERLRVNVGQERQLIGPADSPPIELTTLLRERERLIRELSQAANSDATMSVPLLLNSLEQRDAGLDNTRIELMRVLADLGPKAIAAGDALALVARQGSALERSAAMDALVAVDPDGAIAAEVLLEALQDPEQSVRRAAASAIAGLDSSTGPLCIPGLLLALKNEKNAFVRAAVERAIGKMGPAARPTVPTLRKNLRHPSADVRMWAAVALGAIGDNHAIPALTAMLADEDEDVRVATLGALGRLGSAAVAATAGARKCLAQSETRVAAAYALVQMGARDPLLVSVFREQLKATYPPERADAATALGELGSVACESLSDLRSFREDPNKAVRNAAEAATRRIVASAGCH
jgi:HEAT repeat protein